MNEKEEQRILKVLDVLKKTYPGARTALDFKTPFELLVAVVLSAQCTDVRVNKVTPVLFGRFPDVKSIAEAPVEELEEVIRSTGFYRNKAKNIKAASRLIVEKFGGEVPRTMKELLELPGVARKTANIVLNSGYGLIEGIAVDTHVKRLAARLGMTKHTSPVKIEQDLMKVVPRENWGLVTHLLIDHGRAVCTARKPKCAACPVSKLCPSAFKFN